MNHLQDGPSGCLGEFRARNRHARMIALLVTVVLALPGCVVSPLDQTEIPNIYSEFDVQGFAPVPNQKIYLQFWHEHIDDWSNGVITTRSAQTPSDAEGRLYAFRFNDVTVQGPSIRIHYDQGKARSKFRVLYGSAHQQAVTFTRAGFNCAVDLVTGGMPISEAGNECWTGHTVRVWSRDWYPPWL